MKILFIGLGSIGTRHLKNITNILTDQSVNFTIDALRSSKKPIDNDVSRLIANVYYDYNNLPKYDICYITNPTNLHKKAILQTLSNVSAYFIEKPIFEQTYSVEFLQKKIAYVAAPMRFTSTYLALKELLKTQKPYCARVICSSYLPDWRADTDYSKSYSANAERGGGVCIDLIHEWDYIIDLFGVPLKTASFSGKYSQLDINSQDLAIYIAQYKELLLELHIDYFGRSYKRSIELFTESGTITADFASGKITLQNGEEIDCAEELNARYIKETQYFLTLLKGAKNINTKEKAIQTLAIAQRTIEG